MRKEYMLEKECDIGVVLSATVPYGPRTLHSAIDCVCEDNCFPMSISTLYTVSDVSRGCLQVSPLSGVETPPT